MLNPLEDASASDNERAQRRMADKQLTKQDFDKLKDDVKKVKGFMDDVEEMGGKIPGPLKTAVGTLDKVLNNPATDAIEYGQLVAEAADEASDSLKQYQNDLYAACKTVDQEMQGVCEAQIDRKWQVRSVQFTLDYKNPDSVTSKTIKKLMQKWTPELICKHWDYCAKVGNDAAKGH